MKLINITLFLGALVLAGCNSSGDSSDSVTSVPSTGSIAVGETGDGAGTSGSTPVETGSSSTDAGGSDAGGSGAGDTGGIADDAAGGDGSTAGTTGGGTTGGSTSAVDASAGIESGAGDAVATDSAESVSSGRPSPTSVPPENNQFRAGTLTAADYDDQLNPHLYQSYASDYLQDIGGNIDVPFLDLSRRIQINVQDPNGNPVDGAVIEFVSGSDYRLSLTTPASGTTYAYSDLDNIPEQFTMFASIPGGVSTSALLTLSDVQTTGVINVQFPQEQTAANAQQQSTILDVMFVIDTTGSMGDELEFLQAELTPIIDAIPYDKSLLNIGLTFYRDIGDEYVVRAHGFTNDIGRAQQTLNDEWYAGGGDYPEAMDQALHQAIDANWSQDSRRILFLIADAPPHENKMRTTWEAAEQARSKNIHIVPIAASGVGENAEYLMRSMAAFTNSRYLFLTDDSGFGNPHAEPKIDCYVVTHLDNLMIRVMNSLIFGQRDEPTDNDIIRRVGNYDQGVCEDAVQNQQ